MIYFDYAANTPTDEGVLAYFCEQTKKYYGNPNSNHAAGIMAKNRMDEMMLHMAEFFSIKKEELILTSSASESNNLGIKGIANSYKVNGKHIISTCLEHASVSGSLSYLQGKGYEIDLVDILPDGTVDLTHLKELLREDTILVSICYVDSELGIKQPIEGISIMLKEYPNCHFHVDATQAVGKIPISLEGIDLVTFTAHKFYGINGCGILIKKMEVVIEPLLHGGISTSQYRSGTPTVGLAASMEKALELSFQEMEERNQKVVESSLYLKRELAKKKWVILNERVTTLPHFVNISMPFMKSAKMQNELDLRGICVGTKSACSVPNTPSRAVFAITKDRKLASSSIRITLSHITTKEELDYLLQSLDEIYSTYQS